MFAADARLNEWWPATLIGLVAALLLGSPDGNAQTLSMGLADAQRVADHMHRGIPGWQNDFRRYVEHTTDRQGILARAKGVLAAYRDRCEDSCSADTVRQAVQTASAASCAASVVPLTIDPNFVPPKGTIGFDLQPRGAKTAPGFLPVTPGDPRLLGGEQTLAGKSKDDLSFDSLVNVRRFRPEMIPDGDYRVIVIGAAGQAGQGMPFGNQITINGRTVDIATGPVSFSAELSGVARNVRVVGSSQAPMLVFDLTIDARVLELDFLSGATVSGVLLEPLGNKSVLDLSVAGNGVTSVEHCMSAATELQQAASDDVTTRKNRVSDISGKLTGWGRGSGGGNAKSPNSAGPLSGN
jgi:hypothetical protein